MATRKSGKKASFKSAARIKQLWRQAKTRAAEGKLAEEEKLLRAILDLAPDHYGSLLKLSYMAMGAGRLPIALKYANQAVQVQHADAQGHLMLGQVLSELGLPDLAEAELTIALQLDSQDVRILDSLGGVLTQQGRSAEAEALFRRALELKPDAIGIYYNLVANKKFQRGDPDIAMIEKLSDHKNKFSQDEKIWLHFSLGKVNHNKN